MRIAFYAPMKPPSHPQPSGDRTMARGLVAALRHAGHDVLLASRLRTHEARGDSRRQQRIERLGGRCAARLLRRWSGPGGWRPDLWFTYHLYHKAPDWIGPDVAAALSIPYVVAEASYAAKQATGAWARGCAAAADAVRRADLVFTLNSADAPGLRSLVADQRRMVPLRPFLDTSIFTRAVMQRTSRRRALVVEHGVDPTEPLLLAVGMMRQGDKLASYRVLGEALARLRDRPWTLLVVGDGPARDDVRDALGRIADRVRYLGTLASETLAEVYAAADLFVWPAVGEAWGMVLLEAQAAGLPVVAGRTGGTADVVEDGETGVLVPVRDPQAFAASVTPQLDDPALRRRLGAAAADLMHRRHDLAAAAVAIDAALRSLPAAHGRAA